MHVSYFRVCVFHCDVSFHDHLPHAFIQACKYIPGSELIQTEPSEAEVKLRLALRVLGAFKNYYFEYRAASAVTTPDNAWKFQNSSLFGRLDCFMERCHDMMDMMSTCVQVGQGFWSRVFSRNLRGFRVKQVRT